MSTWRPWLLALSLTIVGCGDDGGSTTPDASMGGAPDAGAQPPDAGDAPDGRTDATLCEEYCGTMMTNCSGANAQYESMEECISMCDSAGWREGQDGDSGGNSLHCRITHAGALAAADPVTHCPHAGPTGGDMCGSLCENYCFYSNTHCAEVHAYEDLSACVSACETLMPRAAAGTTADDNSVDCRVRYVVEAARSGDTAAACAAADVHGNNTCGSWCDVYCDLMETNCEGQPGAYADRDACLTACEGFAADGDPEADSGNTVQCRIFHAGLPALRNAEDECGYAAEQSTNFCIDDVVDPGF